MKTGRLLKVRRPDGLVHVYFYRDTDRYRAVLYLMSATADSEPIHRIEGDDEGAVEGEARGWIDEHFPR